MTTTETASVGMPDHRAERAQPIERLNRAVLTVLGLLLLAAGVYTLLRSYGALGDSATRAPLLTPSARDWVHRNDDVFWPVVAAASTLVGLLALRWLAAQLRTDRPGNADLVWATPSGNTRIHAAAVADAVRRDVEGDHDVDKATVRMVGDAEHPELHLYVDARDDASVADIRDRLEAGAIPNLCTALELPSVAAHARFRLVEPSGRNVQ